MKNGQTISENAKLYKHILWIILITLLKGLFKNQNKQIFETNQREKQIQQKCESHRSFKSSPPL